MFALFVLTRIDADLNDDNAQMVICFDLLRALSLL